MIPPTSAPSCEAGARRRHPGNKSEAGAVGPFLACRETRAGASIAIRPTAGLAQDEERGAPSGEAGGGRGLGPVTSLLLKRASPRSRASARARYGAGGGGGGFGGLGGGGFGGLGGGMGQPIPGYGRPGGGVRPVGAPASPSCAIAAPCTIALNRACWAARWASTEWLVRLPMVSPSRTSVSMPSLVCLTISSHGRHAPGPPNATMAEPPKRKTHSCPRVCQMQSARSA
jgi:hypothetical protein